MPFEIPRISIEVLKLELARRVADSLNRFPWPAPTDLDPYITEHYVRQNEGRQKVKLALQALGSAPRLRAKQGGTVKIEVWNPRQHAKPLWDLLRTGDLKWAFLSEKQFKDTVDSLHANIMAQSPTCKVCTARDIEAPYGVSEYDRRWICSGCFASTAVGIGTFLRGMHEMGRSLLGAQMAEVARGIGNFVEWVMIAGRRAQVLNPFAANAEDTQVRRFALLEVDDAPAVAATENYEVRRFLALEIDDEVLAPVPVEDDRPVRQLELD